MCVVIFIWSCISGMSFSFSSMSFLMYVFSWYGVYVICGFCFAICFSMRLYIRSIFEMEPLYFISIMLSLLNASFRICSSVLYT